MCRSPVAEVCVCVCVLIPLALPVHSLCLPSEGELIDLHMRSFHHTWTRSIRQGVLDAAFVVSRTNWKASRSERELMHDSP